MNIFGNQPNSGFSL